MANNLDLSQLQQLLDHAAKDSSKLRDLKAAFRKLQGVVDEIATVLDDTYEPKQRAKPGRKKSESNSAPKSGRGPGRPKKDQAAEATPQES